VLVARRAFLFVGLCLATACITSEKQVKHEIPRLYSVSDPQFAQTMGSMLGPSLVGGNRFQALLNGDEIFPAMLSAIEGARETINFETYIYWSGVIGKKFSEALSERARAGVKVHLLLDWLGSNKMDPASITAMEEAGAQVTRYHPLRFYNLHRFNNRTHRKLLIVDGRIGFTGGVGIADLWTGHAQDPEHWRDSHYRVEGPVVTQMQAVFIDNWIKATGKVLHGVEYFPVVSPVADGAAQMFSSSPSGGAESMELMYLLAITAAEHSIYLSSAYFVPDEMTRDALVDAVKRGVKVQIITPGPHIDTETVRRASRARWGDLLEAGVEMFEYQPTMYHCKIMIVDERFASVGSTNFDPRSFDLNDEANLNILDAEFAQQQVEVFRRDLSQSRQITFAQFRERPFFERVIEHGASLLGAQL
jgi:Phosphatidylserine/phosphatidylglycerophosphate/cardiolipin synthases and related enzymes